MNQRFLKRNLILNPITHLFMTHLSKLSKFKQTGCNSSNQRSILSYNTTVLKRMIKHQQSNKTVENLSISRF